MGDAGVRPPSGRSVLRGSLAAFRGRLTVASVLLCGHQVCEALVPVLVGVAIDRAVATGDPVQLVIWLAALGVDFLLLSACYRFGARHAWYADVHADARLRRLLAARLLDPRGGAERGRLPGELAAVAVSDAKRVAVVSFVLPVGLGAVVAVVVTAVALLATSLPLGLLILLGTPPLLWLIQRVGRPLERRSHAEQERAAQASGTAADLVNGIRVLKGLGAEQAAVDRYRDRSATALVATLRATRAEAGVLGSVRLVNGLFLAVIALVGGRLAAEGALSIGGLVAAVGLAQFLVGPLEVFGGVSARLAQGRASAERIAAVLAAPPAVTAGPAHLDTAGSAPIDTAGPAPIDTAGPAPIDTAVVRPAAGAVALHGVRTAHLDGIDLEVPAGQLLGVVAADPAVAGDLVRVLGREVDPDTGRVLVDGRSLVELPPQRGRALMLTAAHDAHLFLGTVRENVLAAASSTDGGAEQTAMAAARADQAVEVLPHGLDSQVMTRGRALSGGQRQRIALARALAADPPVLVLHDPTTAIDTVTEVQIADGFARLRRGRTTIVITTSPALLAVTDRTVVLRAGRLVADGTHAELMRTDPAYRELVTA